ncbi:MAG: CHAT domain-containing protein [Gemmatimonas sp.]
MSAPDVSLQIFLDFYRSTLVAIRELARDRGVFKPIVLKELAENPFAVPLALAGENGAESIARNLASLFARRHATNVTLSELRAHMLAAVDEIFASAPDDITGTVRGGDDESSPRGRGNDASAWSNRGATSRAIPRMMSLGDEPPMDHPAPTAAAATGPQSASGSAATVVEPQAVSGRASVEAAAMESSDTARPSRLLYAEIDDHEKNAPLVVDQTYVIGFGVDVIERPNAVGSATLEKASLFPDGIDQVELTVELQGDAFEIVAQKQTFKLKRQGKAETKARFEIVPKREGRNTLVAIVHKERNVVQRLTIELSVGLENPRPPVTTSASRPSSAVTRVNARDAFFVLLPVAPSGYSLTVRDEVGMKTAHLEVEPIELASAIDVAREQLLSVVSYTSANGDDVFLGSVSIAEADQQKVLPILAQAGAALFQLLFDHEGGSDDARAVGNWLRDLAWDEQLPLSIQIMSQRAPIPWPLVYVGDVADDSQLSWDNFLGFRHIFEQLPMVDKLGSAAAAIPSNRPDLQISLNLNRSIDQQMQYPFVVEQETFWKEQAVTHQQLKVTTRYKRDEFVAALARSTTPDQILYFFGHAATSAINAAGGVAASTLVLTDGEVKLSELRAKAPPKSATLPGNPLVFINACQTAQLSPEFYSGFVSYFMSKGARGVIGTECEVAAIFAVEWAKRFFERFLKGESVGALTLALRREFLKRDRNPLGLVYAVHCDGDVQIQPGL